MLAACDYPTQAKDLRIYSQFTVRRDGGALVRWSCVNASKSGRSLYVTTITPEVDNFRKSF